MVGGAIVGVDGIDVLETKLNQKEASSVIQWMNGQPLSTLSVSDLLKVCKKMAIKDHLTSVD